jgi:ubiquitin-protein ligase
MAKRIQKEHKLLLEENNNHNNTAGVFYSLSQPENANPNLYVFTVSQLKTNTSLRFQVLYPGEYPFKPPEIKFLGYEDFDFTLEIHNYLSLKNFFPQLLEENWTPSTFTTHIVKELATYFVLQKVIPVPPAAIIEPIESQVQSVSSSLREERNRNSILLQARALAELSKNITPHPVYEEYETKIQSTIFCFQANEIVEVMQLRESLTKENGLIVPFLSLQEILVIWEPLGVIHCHCFDISSSGSTSKERLPFSFISHKHTSDPDKLGADALQSLAGLGTELIWMDLCSMFQPQTLITGYDYELHTRPGVIQLHKIMNFAEKGRIVLDSRLPERDLLQIKSAFSGIVHQANELQGAIDHFIETVTSKTGSTQTIQIGNSDSSVHGLQETVLLLQQIVETSWFPTNDYFNRLWCYVERLGMNPDSIFVHHIRYPTLQMDLNNHLLSLFQIVFRLSPFLLTVLYQIKYSNSIYKGGPPEMVAYERYLTCWKRLLVSVNQYSFRVKPLFGTGVHFPFSPVLGPFSQVLLLDCYCDADRVIVAELEAKLRGFPQLNVADWTAGLQICLGKREGGCVGRTRLISSRDYNSERKLTQFRIIFAWIKQLLFLSEDSVGYHYNSINIRIKDVLHCYSYVKEEEQGKSYWEVEFPSEWQSSNFIVGNVGYNSRCAREHCLCQLDQRIDFDAIFYSFAKFGMYHPLKMGKGLDIV